MLRRFISSADRPNIGFSKKECFAESRTGKLLVIPSRRLRLCISLLLAVLLSACSHSAYSLAAAASDTTTSVAKRPGFLGAFFRAAGPTPFGVFSARSKETSPQPYPAETTKLFGADGYCDAVDAHNVSISSGYVVDAAKLDHIVALGVGWTRTTISTFLTDRSHIAAGPDAYDFGEVDSAQCALTRHHIEPILGIEAGPVQYNRIPDQFSPAQVPQYKSAAEFGSFCSAVAKHERRTFSGVRRFSLPGNEVNSNPELFPHGDVQIAEYSRACYSAIKREQPKSLIYGFELNGDRNAQPAEFVKRLYDLGCKVGTCYDALAYHISLRFPIPSDSAPCYPRLLGTYGMQCVEDVRRAAHAPVRVLISETGYFVPGNVPNEQEKARAIVDEMRTFAAYPWIDGVAYANVDECGLYTSGYFLGGCLVDEEGSRLPAFLALQQLAKSRFDVGPESAKIEHLQRRVRGQRSSGRVDRARVGERRPGRTRTLSDRFPA